MRTLSSASKTSVRQSGVRTHRISLARFIDSTDVKPYDTAEYDENTNDDEHAYSDGHEKVAHRVVTLTSPGVRQSGLPHFAVSVRQNRMRRQFLKTTTEIEPRNSTSYRPQRKICGFAFRFLSNLQRLRIVW